MPATVQGVAETLPAATGRQIIETFAGIPRVGLRTLFRFTETALGPGFLDDITGTRVQVTGPDGTGNAYAIGTGGGGLILNGMKNLVAPTTLDITQPATILVAATLGLPQAGQRAQAFLILGNPPERGAQFWSQIYADAKFADAYGIWAVGSHDGQIVAGDLLQVRRPWVAQFAYSAVFVVRLTGDGRVRVEERRAGQSSRLVATWDLTKIQGAAGNRQNLMPVILGSNNSALDDFGGTYDCLAVYNRTLDEETIRAWMLAVSGLTGSRGRLP